MRTVVLLFLLSFFLGCDSDDSEELTQPEEEPIFSFTDGFEETDGDLLNLFPENGARWSTIQQENPNGGTNTIAITDTSSSEGDASLYISALKSDEVLSKMDIEKSGFHADRGETIRIKADFYIATTTNIADLLLIDLECCSCWDPSVPNNTCPGVRLMMSGGNDFLSIERGKILHPTLIQTSTPFPRGQWVEVVWETFLSDTEDGINKLFLNGEEILNESGINMPNAQEFAEFAEDQGFIFELQEPLVYERLQVGATANPSNSDLVMLVDKVAVEIFP